MSSPSVYPTMYRMLQSAGNRALDFDPDTRSRLSKLTGKTIAIELLGVQRTVFFQIDDDGVQVLESWEEKTDLTVKGSPLAFARLGILGPDTDIVESGVQIEGDAVLAQHFAKLLKQIDIDWEEWMSLYLGDVVAHQAGNILRDLSRWARDTSATFEQNLAEYLTEEAQVLANSQQVRAFLSAVDVVRADVDRLEQRIRRMAGG